MHVTPRERERLLLAAAADLARRRLARGAPLGATEAVALVCDEVCELAWDGVPLEEVIARARAVIPPAALLPGVAGLVPVIEVEALFPWGSTLVHVDVPFGQDQERGREQAEAARVRLIPDTARSPGEGSGEFAAGAAPGIGSGPGGPPVPGADLPGSAVPAVTGTPGVPGAVLPRAGVIELAPGAGRRSALLRNTGPRDVWISSHFPLGEVNPAVQVRWPGAEEAAPVRDDAPAAGDARVPGTAAAGGAPEPGTAAAGAGAGPRPPWRLDLPAGEALLLRAGEERAVTVIDSPG